MWIPILWVALRRPGGTHLVLKLNTYLYLKMSAARLKHYSSIPVFNKPKKEKVSHASKPLLLGFLSSICTVGGRSSYVPWENSAWVTLRRCSTIIREFTIALQNTECPSGSEFQHSSYKFLKMMLFGCNLVMSHAMASIVFITVQILFYRCL